MSRGARLGALLALILVVCGAVIALDQLHVLDGTTRAPSSSTAPASTPATPPGTNSDSGSYGDLK
ncbi:hypothetical protein LAJ19_12380 [Deinococcus taeanensis]|uniref:hypothetical protein n=1 Tax=Deinococcus taeanensis TaxID=2737050 RepID=UPI001CDC2267|nr:hypothetical protein [Deinococcus taeanensis]UBV42411.1 hypothetical protein LAJ19_12380 [Deinococcus taeanensis]